MTKAPPVRTPESAVPHRPGLPRARGPARGLRQAGRSAALGPGLWPAGMVLALSLAVLHGHGVPVRDIAAFGAYLLLGVTLPGTLVWRAARGGPGHIAEDLAAGTATGYAFEMAAYLPARWAGAPRAFLLCPAAIVLAFVVVPGLRRHWRGSGVHAPPGWSWAVAGLVGLIVLASGSMVFDTLPLDRPGAASRHVDLSFHLALAGELRHHMPPSVPWVDGEPLLYHWFVYADMAATGWATGLPAETLLLRLSPLPMMAVFAVLLAATARGLTSRWWTGPAALVLNYLAIAPTPAPWALSLAPFHQAQLSPYMWFSPTQTFGAALFAALVPPVLDLLRGQRGGKRAWTLVCLLLAAVMGAKATFLPLLLAGLTAVIVVSTARRRRPPRTACALAAVVVTFMLFAQLVLFGGVSLGVVVTPGTTLRILATKIVPAWPGTAAAIGIPLLVLTAGWACLWAGVGGLLRERRALADPAMIVLLGMGAAGIGALLFLWEPGMSQFYFHRSAGPYLAVAAVCGLAAVLPARSAGADRSGRADIPGRSGCSTRSAMRAPAGAWVAGAGLTGTAIAFACQALGGGSTGRTGPVPHRVLLPFLAMLAVAAGVILTSRIVTSRIVAARRTALRVTTVGGDAGRSPGGVPPLTAMAVSLCTALAVPVSLERQAAIWRVPSSPAYRTVGAQQAPPGGIAAARWLRAHSAPGDLVATNAHCVIAVGGTCDNRHFWISAYTERHVLVEGWGYTESNNSRATPSGPRYQYLPFWDRHRLTDNDAVFRAPSASAVGLLRDGYGVRWLLADVRGGASPELSAHTALRFHRGGFSVYELDA